MWEKQGIQLYSALKQLKLIDSKDSIKDFVIIIIIIIKNWFCFIF